MVDYSTKLRLTKISNNINEPIDKNKSVIGKLVFDLKLLKSCYFRMENYKFRVSTTVVRIIELDNETIFNTLNSTYKLENI